MSSLFPMYFQRLQLVFIRHIEFLSYKVQQTSKDMHFHETEALIACANIWKSVTVSMAQWLHYGRN